MIVIFNEDVGELLPNSDYTVLEHCCQLSAFTYDLSKEIITLYTQANNFNGISFPVSIDVYTRFYDVMACNGIFNFGRVYLLDNLIGGTEA